MKTKKKYIHPELQCRRIWDSDIIRTSGAETEKQPLIPVIGGENEIDERF